MTRVAQYVCSLRLQLGIAAGARGILGVLRVVIGSRLGKAFSQRQDAVFGVPVKLLHGAPLHVRPGTSDLRNAAYYYTDRLYLPPPEIADQDLRQICEVGSNMGAAISALAAEYPTAMLLGAEPDPGNAAVARRNAATFGDRCTIVETGIWDTDAELVVDRNTHHGEHGFTVRERSSEDGPEAPTIAALSIDTLLSRHMPDGPIDYLHMTIEGTEPRVLQTGGEWNKRVRSIRAEAHPALDYPAADLIADLERLGYRAWSDPKFPEKWVYGLKLL